MQDASASGASRFRSPPSIDVSPHDDHEKCVRTKPSMNSIQSMHSILSMDFLNNEESTNVIDETGLVDLDWMTGLFEEENVQLGHRTQIATARSDTLNSSGSFSVLSDSHDSKHLTSFIANHTSMQADEVFYNGSSAERSNIGIDDTAGPPPPVLSKSTTNTIHSESHLYEKTSHSSLETALNTTSKQNPVNVQYVPVPVRNSSLVATRRPPKPCQTKDHVPNSSCSDFKSWGNSTEFGTAPSSSEYDILPNDAGARANRGCVYTSHRDEINSTLHRQLSAREILGDESVSAQELRTPTLSPIQVISLARKTFGKSRSLCKPLIAQDMNIIITGTDQLLTREALATKKKDGAVLIARTNQDTLPRTPSESSYAGSVQSDQSSTASSSGSLTHKIIRLGENCVRDMVWLRKGRQALVATDTSFGLTFLDPNDYESLEDVRYETCQRGGRVKSSTLRQMSVSNDCDGSVIRVASGGFDKRIQIWRPDRVLFDRIEPPDVEYETSGVVGSVHWHPRSADLVSWTLDSGTFEMYDVRARSSVRCMNAHADSTFTKDPPLFTHGFIGDTTVMLGFGDGCIKVIDIRKLQVLGGWHDEAVSIIGDITVSPWASKTIITGIGGASIFDTSSARGSYSACPIGTIAFPRALFSPNGLRLPAYACKTAVTFHNENSCVVLDSGGNLAKYCI